MSKNAKNARKLEQARVWSKQRKNGNPGPSKTEKYHTKKNTWYARKDGKYQGKEAPARKQQEDEQ